MRLVSRRRVLASAAASLAVPALAQTWPQRPVVMVVPQPAGNSPDVFCRLLSERLSRVLGQQVVVENRPGAANIVGTQAVARAAPDGYTFLFATSAALVTNPYTFRSLPYDPLKDFTPISMVARSNHVLLVSPAVKAATLSELIALERKAPGSMSLAIDGPRNISGLIAQHLNKVAGTQFVLVPYNTTSVAIQDSMTGRVQATIQSASIAEPQIREGTLRAIAVAGKKRIAALPNVPALGEAFPSADLQGWFMILGPKDLPSEIAARLGAGIAAILKEPEIGPKAADLGFEVDPSGPITPAAAAEFLRAEHAASGRIIRDLGIEPQ